jgi:hypothetical protein
MMWFLYTVTSEERVLDGSFSRLINSLPPNAKVFVAYRGFKPRNEGDFDGELYIPFRTSLSASRNALLSAFPPCETSLNQHK